MSFTPELQFPNDAAPLLFQADDDDDDGDGAAEQQWTWRPIYQHSCAFAPVHFEAVVSNLIANPNITTSWLFRADILSDEKSHGDQMLQPTPAPPLQQPSSCTVNIPVFSGFTRTRAVVRRLIPRNTQRDRPLDQTCVFYASSSSSSDQDDGQEGHDQHSLVVYLPHITTESDIPFYHPKARGMAYLHKWRRSDGGDGGDGGGGGSSGSGTISIHYALFDSGEISTRLRRTALGILSVLCKHGEGTRAGYVKRVQHDMLVPRAAMQDRYEMLKQKYARDLSTGWLESTDPTKHVFEDLSIAAFLMQLWDGMYKSAAAFPGFVDIGCGNGLLVYILNKEGYTGWGFDVRARKSWAQYNTVMMMRNESVAAAGGGKADTTQSSSSVSQNTLQQLVLIPSILSEVPDGEAPTSSSPTTSEVEPPSSSESQGGSAPAAAAAAAANPIMPSTTTTTHPGTFPPGTFIISNHADELTPWTPILAAASDCPFIAIPCCSHRLGGAKFRAPPPPKDKAGTSPSTYGSLVEWVANIAADCGWEVERERLRIPSTRNIALVGRRRRTDAKEEATVDIQAVIAKYGGAAGYIESAMKLVATGPRGH